MAFPDNVTNSRILVDYAEVAEQVLAETSIIREVSNKDILGDISKGEQLKVWVQELQTIQDYVPGTGVGFSDDTSDYVTLNDLKDKALNVYLGGLTVDKAFESMNFVAAVFESAMASKGENIDEISFGKMAIDGTEVVAAGGLKPTVATVYSDILDLKLGLDNAKAPQSGRSLVFTPEIHNLILQVDSKIILNTQRGDSIQASGWVGTFLGFQIYVTTLLPAGTNMIALQERGFAHTDDWKSDVRVISLDGTEKFIGDSKIAGRWAFNNGAVRPTLIQVNNGAV